jgi:hypothetical protein
MNKIEMRKYCLEQAIKFYAGRSVIRSDVFTMADEIYDWLYLPFCDDKTISAGTSAGKTSNEPDLSL